MLTSTYHAPGSPIPEIKRGEIILTHSEFWSGKLIRFGQRLKFRGDRRTFAFYNHCAIARDNDGTIVEALGHGVESNMIGKYQNTGYIVIHTGVGIWDNAQIDKFLRSVIKAHAKYGRLEILSLGLTLITPSWIIFGHPGTFICSGLVAEAMTRAGITWPISPAWMMPADIAEKFGAREP